MDKVGHIEKTHHMNVIYHRTDIESADSCGNCDGALCDKCKDMYIVEDYQSDKTLYRGMDKEKAIELAGYDFCK